MLAIFRNTGDINFMGEPYHTLIPKSIDRSQGRTFVNKMSDIPSCSSGNVRNAEPIEAQRNENVESVSICV